MQWNLSSHERFKGAKGPVVLVILDGVGDGLGDESDAVSLARTPVLDDLRAHFPQTQLTAHGTSVGLPSDADMGNSEVGHNALGCGHVHDQGASLVGKAISSGAIYQGQAWTTAMQRCAQGGALHFIGLLSDGNVHSHLDHTINMLEKAASSGAKSLFVHVLLDGRDVPPTSALQYVDRIEKTLAGIRGTGVDAAVASGGGRMTTTMDRYGADWAMVERGWNAHVLGKAEHSFGSLSQAVSHLREQDEGIGDQNLPTFVITNDDGTPVAPMRDGDSVLLTNFRGDRATEISLAFEQADFSAFERGNVPDVFYAGMMEYDGDTHVPSSFLVAPPSIGDTMGELLARNNVSQLAISETQKFGHVTYFWNGNRSGKFDESLETYIEVPSDSVPFDQRPWMKAAEITDQLIAALQTGKYRFARVNYANGDMVGHTGDLGATLIAMQVLDLQLKRLKKAVEKLDGIMVITADHGNADEMYEHGKDGQILHDSGSGSPMIKTSHTLNPVPFVVYDPRSAGEYKITSEHRGIASVTATCIELLGYAAPVDYEPSLLTFK